MQAYENTRRGWVSEKMIFRKDDNMMKLQASRAAAADKAGPLESLPVEIHGISKKKFQSHAHAFASSLNTIESAIAIADGGSTSDSDHSDDDDDDEYDEYENDFYVEVVGQEVRKPGPSKKI